MSASEIASHLAAATQRVEFYWQFYVVMLTALVGWLISTSTKLNFYSVVLLIVGYVVFVFMNIMGLWGSYAIAEALRSDLVELMSSDPGNGMKNNMPNTYTALRDISYHQQSARVAQIHMVMFAVVLTAILTKWRWQRATPATTSLTIKQYKGFKIIPTPVPVGNKWQISAVITQDSGDEMKMYHINDPETFDSASLAAHASLRKAQTKIGERGEKLFG